MVPFQYFFFSIMAPKQISYSAAAIQVYRISTAPAVYSKLKVVDGKGRKMGLNCWSKKVQTR